MTESNTPQINIEEIMKRIREKAKIQKQPSTSHTSPADTLSKKDMSIDEIMDTIRQETKNREQDSPPLTNLNNETHQVKPLPECPDIKIPEFTSAPALDCKDKYTVREFLNFHDLEFIEATYRAVLGRLPDQCGIDNFLNRLRSNSLTKIEIIGRLRYSREGRRRKALVSGLFFPFMIQNSFRIPVVGYFIRIFAGLLNLPAILLNIQNLENTQFLNREENRQKSKDIAYQLKLLRNHVADTQKIFEKLISQKASKQDVDELVDNVKNNSKEIEELFGNVRNNNKEIEELVDNVKNNNDNIASLNSVISLIEKFVMLEIPSELDTLYAKFEDKFRGTREEIKERQRVYLPYIMETNKNTSGGEILDLGCGNGEWLEILETEGCEAKGIDNNRVMVDRAEKIGLNVISADILVYLKNLPDSSLSAITGFHIIEHLHLNKLISLIDESLRVLKPKGIVIFEAPNPENLTVGAYSFYTDPTHNRPLVPETVSFLLEQRGFCSVEIKRLHKYKDYFDVIDTNETEDKWLYSEMDFSVIGYKA